MGKAERRKDSKMNASVVQIKTQDDTGNFQLTLAPTGGKPSVFELTEEEATKLHAYLGNHLQDISYQREGYPDGSYNYLAGV